MKHLDYFKTNMEALKNGINGNVNNLIKEPINQKDIEDWARWNMNNVPNEYQKQIINSFLDHYHASNDSSE